MTDKVVKFRKGDTVVEQRRDERVSFWRKFKDGVAERVGRVDSWINTLTGIGVLGNDKIAGGWFQRSPRLHEQILEDLYNGDDMAARIVDVVPDEALREGYEITIEVNEDGGPFGSADTVAEAKRIGSDVELDLESRLKMTAAVAEAWAWGRLFGWGAVWIVVDDGSTDQAVELDASRMRSIDGLVVLDRRDVMPGRVYDDPASPKFGQWETFRVNTVGPVGQVGAQIIGVEIHETRLIQFHGARTTNRERQMNEGFTLSVLQRPYDILRQFNLSWAALTNMLQAASQGVFKVDGLIDMIAGGEMDALQTRMALVDLQRSVSRSLLIDAEKEEFSYEAQAFTGVPDALRVIMLRMAAAAKMPVTVLMGMSPAGMNATGESDRLIWAQTIRQEQTAVLKPALERLIELDFRAATGPSNGQEPERWEVTFPSLIQRTDVEESQYRKTIAETDKIYLDTGVLLPEEVALSRFPMGGFSPHTTIMSADREETLNNPPPEPEPPPAPPQPPPVPPGVPPPPPPGEPGPLPEGESPEGAQ